MPARDRMPTKGFLDNVKITNKDGSALTSPTAPFELSNFDTAGDPIYEGTVRADGAWVITAYDIASGEAKYCSGISDYLTAWSDRASQTYDYYYEEF